MAGHANYRITLDMYVGTTAGILDRPRGHRVTAPASGRGAGTPALRPLLLRALAEQPAGS